MKWPTLDQVKTHKAESMSQAIQEPFTPSEARSEASEEMDHALGERMCINISIRYFVEATGKDINKVVTRTSSRNTAQIVGQV